MEVNDTESGLDRFIGEPEIKKITSLSRSTRWRLEREGKFPKKHHLSANRIGYLQSDIKEWLESRATTAPIEPESGAA